MARRAIPFLMSLALALAVSTPPLADEIGGGDSPTIGSIERWLELPAHRRLLASRTRTGVELSPFVTDGCSGGLSAGWSFAAAHLPTLAALHGDHPPWESCCIAHDQAYHAAPGADAEASFDGRLAADRAMRACVLAEGERRKPELMAEYGLGETAVELLYEGIAGAMYRAVRLGGGPCSALPWRWGYGWPYCD